MAKLLAPGVGSAPPGYHTYIGVCPSDVASGGALVESVVWHGPAARAGVRTGDVVTALAPNRPP